MVRLKDYWRYGCNPHDIISIPYGSIKRSNLKRGNRSDNRISIPYGSIKSCSITPDVIAQTKFQFLMVRLKGCTAACSCGVIGHFNSLWFD